MKNLRQFFQSGDEASQEYRQFLKDGYRPAVIFWQKETGVTSVDADHINVETSVALTCEVEASEARQMLTKGLWELSRES